jgi:uncharacterized protein
VNAVPFVALPVQAAWQHRGARIGFEVVFFSAQDSGCLIHGCTTAIEDGTPWTVEYAIVLDSSGATRSARVNGRSEAGSCSTVLAADGEGRWLVDGEDAPQLEGCLDVDLESSAMTNAFPVRRLGLAVAGRAAAPAAYVRAVGLAVERLEQTYLRAPDGPKGHCYDYTAPAFDFRCRLVYDHSGLAIDYPGIAIRAC